MSKIDSGLWKGSEEMMMVGPDSSLVRHQYDMLRPGPRPRSALAQTVGGMVASRSVELTVGLGAAMGIAVVAAAATFAALPMTRQAIGRWLVENKDLFTVGGTVVAALGLVGAAVGLLLNWRIADWNSSRDCLWNFNKRWSDICGDQQNGPRRKADLVLSGTWLPKQDTNVDQVLNFFDSMAYMSNRGHLDDGLAWLHWYDDAHKFWKKATRYVEQARDSEHDWTLWGECESWLARLDTIQVKESRKVQRAADRRKKAASGSP